MNDEERFAQRLAEMDARRAAKKKKPISEKMQRALDSMARKLKGDKSPDVIDEDRSPRPPMLPDPVPEKETGMYRCHVVHHSMRLKFDVLLDPKREGAALYHGATLHISKIDLAKK